jgi:chaperonin GroEL (HSP60 family)
MLQSQNMGIDVLDSKVADVAVKDIYEPLAVKEQVINAAAEAASMILRIDNVIAASKPKMVINYIPCLFYDICDV